MKIFMITYKFKYLSNIHNLSWEKISFTMIKVLYRNKIRIIAIATGSYILIKKATHIQKTINDFQFFITDKYLVPSPENNNF